MKKLITLCFFVLLSSNLMAQDYPTYRYDNYPQYQNYQYPPSRYYPPPAYYPPPRQPSFTQQMLEQEMRRLDMMDTLRMYDRRRYNDY